jgi:hypothetical protein
MPFEASLVPAKLPSSCGENIGILGRRHASGRSVGQAREYAARYFTFSWPNMEVY